MDYNEISQIAKEIFRITKDEVVKNIVLNLMKTTSVDYEQILLQMEFDIN